MGPAQLCHRHRQGGVQSLSTFEKRMDACKYGDRRMEVATLAIDLEVKLSERVCAIPRLWDVMKEYVESIPQVDKDKTAEEHCRVLVDLVKAEYDAYLPVNFSPAACERELSEGHECHLRQDVRQVLSPPGPGGGSLTKCPFGIDKVPYGHQALL
eukprot:jgi/Mesvir1/20089/Mv25409-RA.1